MSPPRVRTQRRPRGRTSAINDKELGFRRQEIQSRLEEHWGEIGWACMHSRTPDDVRKAFAVLLPAHNSTSGRLVECLTRESLENVTGAEVAGTRRRYWQAGRTIHRFAERYNSHTQKMEQLNRAKTELLNPSPSNLPSPREAAKNLRYVNDQISRLLDEGKKLKSELDQARAIEDKLYEELQLGEPVFARSEILNFLMSKRYALNPKNFAYAIAGLPFMGWRQSMKRNIIVAKEFGDRSSRPAYCCFLAFEYMLQGKRPRSWDSVGVLLNKEIPHLPKMHREAKSYLIENMPWLRESLQILKREPLITRRTPYVLSSAFWRAVIRPKSNLERVLASADLTEN